VLWPKGERGRPRNETLAALAKSQRCSERQARRLLASSKQRKRVRETPTADEKWALQQREKRAQLVQALKHENDLNRIACTLENLNPDWAGALFEVNIRVRELAEQMVAKAGTVLLKCSFALQSIGLRFALNALGCSRSTIYRKFSGRLDSLRTDGEILRAYDLSQVDTQIGSKPPRPSARKPKTPGLYKRLRHRKISERSPTKSHTVNSGVCRGLRPIGYSQRKQSFFVPVAPDYLLISSSLP
jgi:hypothetical protein